MEAAGGQVPLTVDHAYPRSRHLLRLASDQRLVARVRAGSELAFTVLYERHYRKVLSFCRHMLGSADEAEDAVQQSFISAYRDMLRDDKELNFRPWLYRIARNHCISVLRARRPVADLDQAEPSTIGLSEQVADRDELRDLLRDLAQLPTDQREALVLAELHDNSHTEIAEIVGCDREKVKSLVFQARNSLIKSREARETSCEEIRKQLSVLHGGALRRSVIRRHLAECEGCRSWRRAVKAQRSAMAILMPVVPSSALKFGAANAIAAAGVAGGVSSGAAAGGALSGTLTGLAAKLGVPAVVVKGAATAATVAVVATGGTVAVKEVDDRIGNDTPAAQTTPPGPRFSEPEGAIGAPATSAPGPPAVQEREANGEKAAGRQERRARGAGKGARGQALLAPGSDRKGGRQVGKTRSKQAHLDRGLKPERAARTRRGKKKTPVTRVPRRPRLRLTTPRSKQPVLPEQDPLLDPSDPTLVP
jgi:RNA polymerase sigma factor (sigma-70 family)